MDTCCYCNTIREFLEISENNWLSKMQNKLREIDQGTIASNELIQSWRDCFNNLQRELRCIPDQYKDLIIIFEYLVPINAAYPDDNHKRRADVLILGKDKVFIMEFKSASFIPGHDYGEYVAQLYHYYDMIHKHHRRGEHQHVYSGLVFTGTQPEMNNILTRHYYNHDEYYIGNPRQTIGLIQRIFRQCNIMTVDEIRDWISKDSFSSVDLLQIYVDAFNKMYQIINLLKEQNRFLKSAYESSQERIELLEHDKHMLEEKIEELEVQIQELQGEETFEYPDEPMHLIDLFELYEEHTEHRLIVHAGNWTNNYCFVPLERRTHTVKGFCFVDGEYHSTRCIRNDTIVSVFDCEYKDEIEEYVLGHLL